MTWLQIDSFWPGTSRKRFGNIELVRFFPFVCRILFASLNEKDVSNPITTGLASIVSWSISAWGAGLGSAVSLTGPPDRVAFSRQATIKQE